MAIDYESIMSEFVKIARDAVGNQLSTINRASPIPSVIKARQDGPKPEVPYVVLDLLPTSLTDGWELAEGIDGDGNPYFETSYKILFQYTVYGGNASKIAHELENYFRIPRVIQQIRANTNGSFEGTTPVLPLPQKLATNYLEVASFNFTFNIIDRITDIQTGVFDTINNQGQLARYVGDPNPLAINVSETST